MSAISVGEVVIFLTHVIFPLLNLLERISIFPFSERKHLFSRSGPVHLPSTGEPDSGFAVRMCGEDKISCDSSPFAEKSFASMAGK